MACLAVGCLSRLMLNMRLVSHVADVAHGPQCESLTDLGPLLLSIIGAINACVNLGYFAI